MGLRMMAQGEAILPLRSTPMVPDGESLMAPTPSQLGSVQSVGVKVVLTLP